MKRVLLKQIYFILIYNYSQLLFHRGRTSGFTDRTKICNIKKALQNLKETRIELNRSVKGFALL